MPTVRPPSRTHKNIARGRRFSISNRSTASSLGFSAAVTASTKNSAFIASQPSSAPPGSSNPFDGLQPPGGDRAGELLVVLLVLVGVALREVGGRFVERVAAAEVGGDGDRVSGAGVGAGQGPPADAGVIGEPERDHRLDQGGAFHVAQLAPVEVAVHIQALGPAEVDVAGGLHHPLPLHDPLSVLPVAAV